MIGYLSGTVIEVRTQSILLLSNNVGFELYVPKSDYFAINGKVEVYAYMHWSADNGPSMYGFKSVIEKDIFMLIIDCPKIGPKVALSILSHISPTNFLESVAKQEEKALSTINGIGTKKAEIIISHLKHKVAKLLSTGELELPSSNLKNLNTLSEALLSLGYTKQETAKAITHISKDSNITTDQFDLIMRQALAFLSTRP